MEDKWEDMIGHANREARKQTGTHLALLYNQKPTIFHGFQFTQAQLIALILQSIPLRIAGLF